MKRRTLLRGLAAAVAIGMAPAFLNKTELEVFGVDMAEGRCIGTMSLWKIGKDGSKQLISAKEIPVEDNGIDSMVMHDYPGRSFKFPAEGNVSEVGLAGGGTYQRFELNETITVTSDEYLEMEYRYERA